MKNRVDMKTIAEICGVSTATVSRILNKNGRYSQQTEARVLEAVEKYGYHTNQSAKGLRTAGIDAIGVIVPDITNEFFSAIVLSVQETLFQDNYSCVIFNTNETASLEKQCVERILSLNVSGVISIRSLQLNGMMKDLHLPTAFIDCAGVEGGNNRWVCVSSDHEYGAYLAGRELIEKGCRNLLCITALADNDATGLRNAGFLRACRESGLDVPPERFRMPKRIAAEESYEIVREVFASGETVDGIFCETDWLGIGAVNALRDLGIRVPQDVKVVGFDNIRPAAVAGLTTIHQSSRQIGRVAAESVMQMIRRETPPQRQVTLPVRLVRRSTT